MLSVSMDTPSDSHMLSGFCPPYSYFLYLYSTVHRASVLREQ